MAGHTCRPKVHVVTSVRRKYRIGLLRQGKPTHRTDQDIVPTPGVGLGLGLGSDASLRVIRRFLSILKFFRFLKVFTGFFWV